MILNLGPLLASTHTSKNQEFLSTHTTNPPLFDIELTLWTTTYQIPDVSTTASYWVSLPFRLILSSHEIYSMVSLRISSGDSCYHHGSLLNPPPTLVTLLHFSDFGNRVQSHPLIHHTLSAANVDGNKLHSRWFLHSPLWRCHPRTVCVPPYLLLCDLA